VKPLRLEMSAFGPFSGRECIDFSVIQGRSLLLIHGPTGAGKTTILDAMCFALFGDTSGNEREAKEMRSDTAGPSDLTYVSFEFRLGEREFRVLRHPEQESARKKGKGTKVLKHQALLWERKAGEGEKGAVSEVEEILLADGASKVKESVTELFGFKSEQFRQVVLLPQGKFRELLLSNSKDRERILERLFDTAMYGKLEQVLEQKTSLLGRAFEDDKIRLQGILARAEVSTEVELLAQMEGTATLHEAAKPRLLAAQLASEIAGQNHASAMRDQEKLREAELAKLDHEKLLSQRQAMLTLEAECGKALRAQPLATMLEDVELRRVERALAVERQTENTKALASATEYCQKVRETLNLQDGLEGERKLASQGLVLLEQKKTTALRLANAQALHKSATLGERKLAKEEKQMAARLTEFRLERSSAQGQLASAKEARARIVGLELGLESALATYNSFVDWKSATNRQHGTQRDFERAQLALQEVDRKLGMDDADLRGLEVLWIAGQAGALAKELSQDSPCPVCGNTVHPSPAGANADAPSDEELKAKRKSNLSQQKRAKELAVALSAMKSKLDSEVAALSRLAEGLESKGENYEEELQAEVARCKEELHAARSSALEGEKWEQRLLLADREIAELTLLLLQSAARLRSAEREVVKGVTLVTELSDSLPQQYQDPKVLADAIASEKKALESMMAELKRAQSEMVEAASRIAGAEQQVDSGRRAAEGTMLAHDASEKRLEGSCVEAGFLNVLEFQEAYMDSVTLQKGQQELLDYSSKEKAASERLVRTREETKGVAIPDMEALEGLFSSARDELATAIEISALLRGKEESLWKIRDEFGKMQRSVSDKESSWKAVASVSKLASGKVPPQKLSFQRFVLGAYLDEVLLAATERLLGMSKGRYRLTRLGQGRHRGRASGLDLEVLDNHSGVSRPVNTLSGGESFLAALALSLGLADVVQSYSGGRRLDTLFVDEGFGTLDASALDLALDTLSELNQDGRLVGIISHVDELKNRIATRLEVKAGQSGSSTSFHLD